MNPLRRWAITWASTAAVLACTDAPAQSVDGPAPAPLVAKPVVVEETSAFPVETPLLPPSAVASVPIPNPAAEEALRRPRAPEEFTSAKPVAAFAGDREIVMRNVTDFRQFRIPVPWRAKWPEMRVDLKFRNAEALVPERSRLELWWAGGMIAQHGLDGKSAEARLLAEIPNRRIRPGAHPLEFRVLHHAGDPGGDPFSEDLWTRIDPDASTVTLKYRLRSLSPVLSDLPRLLDRHGWEPFRLRLVTAETWALTGIHLEWMSRVLERSALLLDPVPMEVEHRATVDETGDHFVIGLTEEILPILPRPIAEKITESFVGIFPHPLDDRFFIAVVAGKSREGIEKAVRAFAATEFGLPPEPFLDLTGIDLPGLPPVAPSVVLRPGERRSFAEMGGTTRELQGLSTERMEVPVRLPAGIDASGNANLKLKLRMVWSPVRKDSTIDVYVNGSRELTIPIGKADPPRFDDYELDIPLGVLQPGKNIIGFQPNLIPPHAGEGKPVNWDNLRIVLQDDSTASMPLVDREIRLPDLGLTARSAIPAAGLGTPENPHRFTVFLSDRDPGTVSAGCTLLGKFAQAAGRRIPLARLSFEPPETTSDFAAVGSESTIPRKLISDRVRDGLEETDRALVSQFASPLNEARIGLALVAADGFAIEELARQVIEPALWQRLSGDTVMLGRAGGTWETLPGRGKAVTIYHDAGMAAGARANSGISTGFILYPAGIVLLIAFVFLWFFRRGRRRDQLPGRVSIDAPMWSLGSKDRI